MPSDRYSIVMQWYDRFLDFAKQKATTIVWVFLCSGILLFVPTQYLRLLRLDDFVDLVGPVIGLLFLLSGVLIAINCAVFCRNQYAAHRNRQSRKNLLARLTELYEIEELATGFKSQQDCIAWANSVAPLLLFNEQYYANFMVNSHQINNIGISGNLAGSLVNTMKSQVAMAIAELKKGLDD